MYAESVTCQKLWFAISTDNQNRATYQQDAKAQIMVTSLHAKWAPLHQV